jgi:hypothetical protein
MVTGGNCAIESFLTVMTRSKIIYLILFNGVTGLSDTALNVTAAHSEITSSPLESG